MPALDNGETQLAQSDKEIASWRLNHAGTWQEQSEPPLAIFYIKTKFVRGGADMKLARLRPTLVHAADMRSDENLVRSADTFPKYKATLSMDAPTKYGKHVIVGIRNRW